MHVYIYACAYVCACVCVHTHTHTSGWCVCVHAGVFSKLHIVICDNGHRSEMLLLGYLWFLISAWRLLRLFLIRSWAWKHSKTWLLLLNVLMVHPSRAGWLQSPGHGSNDTLASNAPDSRWGWRQSTQNGTLLAPRGGIGQACRSRFRRLPLP